MHALQEHATDALLSIAEATFPALSLRREVPAGAGDVQMQLAASIAHDMNNFLQCASSALHLTRNVPAAGRPADGELIDTALLSLRKAGALAGSLAGAANADAQAGRQVDVNETIAGMQPLLQSVLGAGIRLSLLLRPGLLHVFCNQMQLESALLNLAINAREAMRGSGSVTVETEIVATTIGHFGGNGGGFLRISVGDTGTGMEADVMRRAFEPFFTTRGDSGGTGLGLATIRQFAERTGGHAEIDSAVGKGTQVHLVLPYRNRCG